ncbi:uncharacterized protein EV422DRAFT_514190 [Fimicolochytrium jonesii]|uniref:uncharacterized protein n=1 Tax=Fimicolochytrium jonesii TaxID=1396493 RepID=UPI0022FF0B99|nr:uncharacterized protein EV422DRAFT_514190 [Fimicolochytrium jonesii]KAI8825802.1 hypothetical protein EV422DRAFT_514190 [Fimicolochytrium jonesii]
MTETYACPCLNVKVTIARSPDQPPVNISEIVSVEHFPVTSGIKAQLGLGGIRVAHPLLVKHTLLENAWLEVRCMNCSCAAYFIRVDPASHHTLSDLAAHSSPDGSVILGHDTIHGEGIQEAKEKATYSESCQIVLTTNHVKAEHSPEEYGLSDAYNTLQASMKRHMESQRIKMEERIAAYRKEQQAQLDREHERVRHETEILWAQICDLHKERLHRHSMSLVGGSGRGEGNGRAMSPNGLFIPDSQPITVGSFYQRSDITLPPPPMSSSVGGRRRSGMGGGLGIGQADRRKSSPAVTPSGTSPSQNKTQTMDIPPEDDATSAGEGEADGTHARKVRFGQVSLTEINTNGIDNGDEMDEDESSLASPDGDAIFDLDGFEEPAKPRYADAIMSEADDDDDTDVLPDSPTQAPEPSPRPLFSSSLPIRIPSMGGRSSSGGFKPPAAIAEEQSEMVTETSEAQASAVDWTTDPIERQQRQMLLQMGVDPDAEVDEESFVAPHIFTARTFTEDYLLAQRPQKSRKTSFAI